MEDKRILVAGGTGYIGSALVDRLARNGHSVSIVTRNRARHDTSIHYLIGNLLDRDFVYSIVKDYDMVVFLAGVVRSMNKPQYRDNAIILDNVLTAMHLNNVQKIIFFSTQNVFAASTGPYGRSKMECEDLLKKKATRGLEYMIVRPNYVYGIDQRNDFYRLYRIMRSLRICPILGDGNTRFQPINKNDLAELTAGLIKKWQPGAEINVSGKDTVSMNEAARLIMEDARICATIIHLPLGVIKLFSRFVPFDVDGYGDDKLPPHESRVIVGKSGIRDDIGRIIESTTRQ